MRLDRLLAIIIIISQKGLVTGKELAEHFEVSLRTIYRDIEKISEAYIPIAATYGKGGGYYIMENYNLDKLFFNKKEAEPLIAVMENLKFLFGKNQQFNDIVLKFETLQNNQTQQYEKLSIDMSHFSMEQELRDYLYLTNKAIEDNRLLKFEYINRRMECCVRTVEPLQIKFARGHWYIIAFCRDRKDYRMFKLVRVKNMKLADSFVKRSISIEEVENIFSDSYMKNSISVTLKFSNKIGGQLSEYFSKTTIIAFTDGTFLVEDFFPNDEGLKKFILSFGAECEVIAPRKLREDMLKYIKKIRKKYNE